MTKNNITLGFVGVSLFFFMFIAGTVSAATKGEQALQDMLNAESARIAELSAQYDPALGIVHTLKKNSSGNDVKLLQQFLKVYGVYPQGMITGYFGSLTEAAVRKFQQKEGLDVVGIAGPKTRARMKEISRKQTATAVAATTPLVSSSLIPAIADAVLASSVADNGSAVGIANTFASTTQNIYAILSIKDVAQDAQIAYIRYFKGNYVDSEVSHPSRSNLAYFHFQWSLKPGANRVPGSYSLVFFLNGKAVQTVPYSIY